MIQKIAFYLVIFGFIAYGIFYFLKMFIPKNKQTKLKEDFNNRVEELKQQILIKKLENKLKKKVNTNAKNR